MFAIENIPDARLARTIALALSQSLAASQQVVSEQVIVDGLQKYCPHKPFGRQMEALLLPDREVLYGGEAGAGKTDWLAMCALQYVHVPGYQALILRRNLTRLRGGDSVLDRLQLWLKDSDARWDSKLNGFVFPTGAQIKFGFLDHSNDRFAYLGHGYQLIAWEELTDFLFSEEDWDPYRYLFRSLRKPTGMPVPLRMRATTNPGGVSHHYVKNRYVSEDAMDAVDRNEGGVFESPGVSKRGRKYVHAKTLDNSNLDYESYEESLDELPPVTRARQKGGNWRITENVIIDGNWFGKYTTRGNGEILLVDGVSPIDCRLLERFATIDTAGTSREKAEAQKGKAASWSVCCVWDYWRDHDLLFLRHVWRDQVDWNALKGRVPQVLQTWRVRRGYTENAHFGDPLCKELCNLGLDWQTVPSMLPGMHDGYRGAKLERAVASGLLDYLEAGRLLLPADEPVPTWVGPYKGEFTRWSGLPDEPADQIDGSSYGVFLRQEVSSGWGGAIRN